MGTRLERKSANTAWIHAQMPYSAAYDILILGCEA